MKLLFISHEAGRSGAPLLLLSFLRWLAQRDDVQFDILLLRDGPLRPEFARLGNTVTADELSGRNRATRRVLYRSRRHDEGFWIDRACRALVARQRYDVIYGNTIVSLPWLAKLAELTGTPTICHLHEMAWAVEQFFSPSYIAQTLPQLEAIVACSRAVALDLQELFSADSTKITVVDSFIDTDIVIQTPPGEIRQSLGLPSEAVVIGSVGKAETRKGADLMVLLLDRLVRRDTPHDFRVVWVGTSPHDAALSTCRHDLRKLGLADRFTFVEHTPQPNDYVNAFDIFAMTSREEPMGMAALDAACLGRPLVAFAKASGITDLIGDEGGYTVPYLDIDAMADTILRILDNPDDSARRARAMRDRVLSRYTLEAAAPALLRVIDAASGPSPRSAARP